MSNEILVSEVDGVENLWIPHNKIDTLNSNVIGEVDRLLNLVLVGNLTLLKLEQILKGAYGEGKLLYLNGIRFANCFAWKRTQLHRDAKTIIISQECNLPRPTNTNMGRQVIDPIGFASKTSAPTGGNGEGYGILGKISALRPMSDTFNEKLYEELMNLGITVMFNGIAKEKGPDETAIMPTFEIIGGEDLILPFSEEKQENDIPTAKWYGVNS